MLHRSTLGSLAGFALAAGIPLAAQTAAAPPTFTVICVDGSAAPVTLTSVLNLALKYNPALPWKPGEAPRRSTLVLQRSADGSPDVDTLRKAARNGDALTFLVRFTLPGSSSAGAGSGPGTGSLPGGGLAGGSTSLGGLTGTQPGTRIVVPPALILTGIQSVNVRERGDADADDDADGDDRGDQDASPTETMTIAFTSLQLQGGPGSIQDGTGSDTVLIAGDPSLFPTGQLDCPDVLTVLGLDLDSLLGANAKAGPVHRVTGKVQCSFSRAWDGTPFLEALAGAQPPAGGLPTTVTLSVNAAPALDLVLGNAKFDQWTLASENGVSATESARFTYTTRQIQ